MITQWICHLSHHEPVSDDTKIAPQNTQQPRHTKSIIKRFKSEHAHTGNDFHNDIKKKEEAEKQTIPLTELREIHFNADTPGLLALFH